MNTAGVATALALWWASISVASGQLAFDVETGGAFPGYNDVRIPGKGGTISKAVQFQDRTFGANTPLDAEWKFNSYRLTYRYRAEDVLAALVLRLSKGSTMRAGYRILEGGADNDEVYNFALFHYVLAGR